MAAQVFFSYICFSLNNDPACSLSTFKAHQARWLAAAPGEDHFRRPGPIRCDGNDEDRPITLVLNALTGPPGA